MIATRDNRRYLVECYIPLNFVRKFSSSDSLGLAFADWKDAMNGVFLIPDARRYGALNKDLVQFWVEEVGSLIRHNRLYSWGYFEMYIRCGWKNNIVYETLCGLNGPHFFMINICLSSKGTSNGGILVEKFLTPVLMAKNYPGYELAMDAVFNPLSPLFHWKPNSDNLPACSLH